MRPRVETAISAAVMTELRAPRTRGTYERVAARAATSEPVPRRRWPTSAEMVMAAVITSTAGAIAAPDTGDLAQDLETLLFAMRDKFGTSSRSAMLGVARRTSNDAAESPHRDLLLRSWPDDTAADWRLLDVAAEVVPQPHLDDILKLIDRLWALPDCQDLFAAFAAALPLWLGAARRPGQGGGTAPTIWPR